VAQFAAARLVPDRSVAVRLAAAVSMLSAGRALPKPPAGAPRPSRPVPWLDAEFVAVSSIFVSYRRRGDARSWWQRGSAIEKRSRPRQTTGKENYRDARRQSFSARFRARFVGSGD